jgi:beta-mannosidase
MAKAQALSAHVLSKGWTFKQADDTADDAWVSVNKVPTNVHLDLMDHGKYVSTFQESEAFCRN